MQSRTARPGARVPARILDCILGRWGFHYRVDTYRSIVLVYLQWALLECDVNGLNRIEKVDYVNKKQSDHCWRTLDSSRTIAQGFDLDASIGVHRSAGRLHNFFDSGVPLTLEVGMASAGRRLTPSNERDMVALVNGGRTTVQASLRSIDHSRRWRLRRAVRQVLIRR